MQLGILLTYFCFKGVVLASIVVPQDTEAVLRKAAFQLVSPQDIQMLGDIPPCVQDPAFLVELRGVPISHSLACPGPSERWHNCLVHQLLLPVLYPL